MMKAIDLFCGAGGLSEGFKQAGFEIVAGIDKDKESLETFKKNNPESIAIEMDLGKTFGFESSPLKEISDKKIDVVIGGPPCQGLSIAGKQMANDPRNMLYKAYFKMIKHYEPRAVILENVPTILSLYDGKIAKAIIKNFEEMGFKTSVLRLNASDYGVPQNRRRVFFVALKSGMPFDPPEPFTNGAPITTRDALDDLPTLENETESFAYVKEPSNTYQKMMRDGTTKLENHWAVQHTEKTKKIISLVPDGKNYKSLPKGLQKTRKVNIAWTRMDSAKPCFTIDAGHNHHFHYSANRVPTVRECARIQSFPDRYVFYGKKISQFKQVGNAVPPLLSKAIANKLREKLDGI